MTEHRKPARIKEVAALAGVSLKTVSNVVHDRPCVRSETRARVQAAIEQLGYRPSLAGRQLRIGRSNLITLAVPRIDEPYLGALAHAMIAAAAPRGYTVVIDETSDDLEREAQAASGYPGHAIDGVIYSPAALDPEHVSDLSHGTPMVVLGEQLVNSRADHVAIDNVASARELTGHLIETGRTKIGFLGYQSGRPRAVNALRLDGFREQMAAAGLKVNEDLIVPAAVFSRAAGEAGAREFLQRLPAVDAVICASDLLAIGLLSAFRSRGVQVPGDVAVAGWDNTIDGAYCAPSLTSIAPDLGKLAEQALDALVRRIEDGRETVASYVVPHRLVIRESSAAPTPGSTAKHSRHG